MAQLDVLSEKWFSELEMMFRSQGWVNYSEQLQTFRKTLVDQLKIGDGNDIYRIQGRIQTAEQLLNWPDYIATLKTQMQEASVEGDANDSI